jgi:hypothetical protein
MSDAPSNGVPAVERVLGLLEGVKQYGSSGSQWMATCPSHPDPHGTLGVGLWDGGRVLVFCHHGCKFADIVAALGGSVADLFAGQDGGDICALPDGKGLLTLHARPAPAAPPPASPPPEGPGGPKKELLPHHLEQLRKGSGLSDETIALSGMYSTTDPELFKAGMGWKPGWDFGAFLVIPFPKVDGTSQDYGQMKPDRPRVVEGKPVKYESPSNKPSHLYFPPRSRALVNNVAVPLLIVEGPKKALAGDQADKCVIGLMGVENWSKGRAKNDDGEAGERLALDELEAIPVNGRACHICYDNDGELNQNVERAKTSLAAYLTRRKAVVGIVNLPPGPPDAQGRPTKCGLDDYLLTHTVAELDELIKNAAGPPGAEGAAGSGFKYKPIDSKTFASTNYQCEWLVRFLLVAGQPALIGGPSKCMKTSVALDLAISLASATDFLGHAQFRVPAPRKVAVLSGESGEAVLKETALRICKAKGLDLATLPVDWQFTLPQLACPADVAELARGLKESKVEVAMIDPCYLCLTAGSDGKELSAANLFDIGPLLLSIAQACKDANVTPVLVHHTKKTLTDPYVPLELPDLAFSGFAEFGRQWVLINRREKYQGGGDHKLWLGYGGCAGQGGCLAVDIAEGELREDFTGRTWGVTVKPADGVQSDDRAARLARQDRDDASKVLATFRLMLVEAGDKNAPVPYLDLVRRSGLPNGRAKAGALSLENEGVIKLVDLPKPDGVGGKSKRGVTWGARS